MDLQRLLSLTRKAMDDYQMIQEGDKIAVGISGGKDSLTLLYAMANLRQFYPKKFSLKSQKSFSVIKMRRHPALSVQNSAKVH